MKLVFQKVLPLTKLPYEWLVASHNTWLRAPTNTPNAVRRIGGCLVGGLRCGSLQNSSVAPSIQRYHAYRTIIEGMKQYSRMPNMECPGACVGVSASRYGKSGEIDPTATAAIGNFLLVIIDNGRAITACDNV